MLFCSNCQFEIRIKTKEYRYKISQFNSRNTNIRNACISGDIYFGLMGYISPYNFTYLNSSITSGPKLREE